MHNQRNRFVLSFALILSMLFSLSSCTSEQTDPWQEQYDAGVRHLQEEKYEEAISAFESAIETDNQKVEAYTSLASVYMTLHELDKAVEVLQKGKEVTGSAALDGMLDEALQSLSDIQEPEEVVLKEEIIVKVSDLNRRSGPSTSSERLGLAQRGETYPVLEKVEAEGYTWYRIAENEWVAGNSEWIYCIQSDASVEKVDVTLSGKEKESLEDFYKYMRADFNSAEASLATGYDNFLSSIAGHLHVALYYPTQTEKWSDYWNAADDHWDERDPNGWWGPPDGQGYGTLPVDVVEWNAEIIYNISPDDIEKLSKQGESDKLFYVWEDKYYFPIYGVGGVGYLIDLKETRTDGQNYYIIYDAYYATYDYHVGQYYSVMELKAIDGQEFWTVHFNTTIWESN